jgi:hypothetical protein
MRKCKDKPFFNAISLKQGGNHHFMTNIVKCVKASYWLFKNKRGHLLRALRTQNLELFRTATFQSRFFKPAPPSQTPR